MNSVFPTINGEKVYCQLGQHKLKQADIIVIGSGMAGMSCAAALSKMGHKVIVLEQHYLPGGYTHSFQRKGFCWDAGVHAIGEMDGRSQLWRMLNWLSDGGVKWNTLGETYDEFNYPDGFKIAFPDSKIKFIKTLKDNFPNESEKIDLYFKICKQVSKETKNYFAFKVFPKWVDEICTKITSSFQKNWWNIKTNDVLDELGMSEKLKLTLTAQWGYYGNIPKESSFAIHALTQLHFSHGAYYPIGGSKELAAHLLKQVKKNGGEVICQALVKELMMDQNKTCGVRLKNGDEFFASKIISAASATNTVKHLVPEHFKRTKWGKEILKIKSSPSYICLNLGFEGDISKLGAGSSNKWFYNSYDPNITGWDIEKREDCPILYVSFPSLKDPLHEAGPKEKHTGEVVTFVPYEEFCKWKDSEYKKRPEDYEELKNFMKDRLIQQLTQHMPELMEKLVYAEISTPLTAEHFAGAFQGAIYGLEATPERFLCKDLRPSTPIRNFYLTGVDTSTTGVVGAMTSGMLTASAINKRVLKFMI